MRILRERRARSTLLTVALSAALLLQIGWIAVVVRSRPKIVPIEPGMMLPFDVTGAGGQITRLTMTPGQSCRVAFICTVRCPVCAQVAEHLSAQRSQIPADLKPLWLMVGDSASVGDWAAKHGVNEGDLLRLSQKAPARLTERPKYGDLWFTPFRTVLAGDLRILDARPADQLPDQQELRLLCQGGTTPSGLVHDERVPTDGPAY